MDEANLNKALARIIGNDKPDTIKEQIYNYQQFYELPIIQKEEKISSRLFQFYRRGENFIVLAICNPDNEILIISEGTIYNDNNSLTWQLVGGFIRQEETVADVCDRLVKQKTNLEIDEIEPLALVQNEFKCESKSVIHSGLAFLVYTRGIPSYGHGVSGTFVSEIPEQLAFSNKEILSLAFEKIKSKKTFAPYDEIEVGHANAIKMAFHKKILNKPFDFLSSHILKQHIKKHCKGSDTILDVACGDDTLILELAKEADLCIANDISWKTLRRLRTFTTQQNIIFSNHNALELPYKKVFDIVICKNVLHHMHNLDEIILITQEIQKIARKIIIVDIENPEKSTFAAKLWHRYYEIFLGDKGHFFLTESEFRESITQIYKNDDVIFEAVSTIKGKYLIAVVTTSH